MDKKEIIFSNDKIEYNGIILKADDIQGEDIINLLEYYIDNMEDIKIEKNEELRSITKVIYEGLISENFEIEDENELDF